MAMGKPPEAGDPIDAGAELQPSWTNSQELLCPSFRCW
jgi:hypothetical protein